VPGGAGAPLLRRGHPATLGGDVDYVGEVDHHRKVELLAGARALVNPIRWDEPFSLVMVEALACGTPVVATHHGAAPELVDHGLTGFIAGTATDLAAAVNQVEGLDRQACRDAVERDFSMHRMAADHAAFYRTVVDTRGDTTPAGPHQPTLTWHRTPAVPAPT
jgi:glycosyltransferase involved in cell wall biosynthesis